MTDDTPFVDWLAARLRQAGTRRIFGVPGGGTSLDLIAAARRQGIEMVLTAREDAAVIMAGVSGVLAEAPGVAFATKGPGLASAANGLASASLDRMPALLIAETFVPGELGYVSHQAFDQAALAAPLLQGGMDNVLEASVDSVEAWFSAGPMPMRAPAVMFPTSAELRRPAAPPQQSSTPSGVTTFDRGDIDRAREMLQQSGNPVVIVGLDAARPALAEPLRALLEGVNAAALTTYMAAGSVPFDHPNFAGIFTGGEIEKPCVDEADLIALVGLDPVELIRKPWTYRAPVLDLCEIVREPHYLEPALRLCAPLAELLTVVCPSTPPHSSWSHDRIRAHRERFLEGLEIESESELSSSEVVKAVAGAFAGRPRLSVDAGAHMFSACTFWPAKAARDVLISNGLATMGFAIPAGIAAALHEPSRGAVAMTGDGGAMMCLGELKTAATTGANVCIVVFNDGRLSLIDLKREERQMPDLGLTWSRPDFAAVAAGFGLRSWRPASIDELSAACAEAAASDGPCLIDAQIDSSGYLAQMKSLRG